MNYLQRNKKDRSNLPKWLLLLVVFVIFINLLPAGTFSFFRPIVSPLWNLKERVSEDFAVSAWFRQKESIIKENNKLKSEMKSIEIKLLDRNLLYEENQELWEILNNTNIENSIVARVLVRPPISFYDTIIVNVGKEDGVKIGDSVSSFGIVPIGTIIEVGNKTSLAKLYSSFGEKIQATLSLSNTQIELAGAGGGSFLSKIPKSINVKIGEKVTLPGTTQIIGVVFEVEEKDTDSFKKLYIKSPINIFEIKTVEITRK